MKSIRNLTREHYSISFLSYNKKDMPRFGLPDMRKVFEIGTNFDN